MWFELMLRDEYRKGISEGEALGKAKGKSEAILDLLEDLGPVSPALHQQIMQETDPSVLKTMLIKYTEGLLQSQLSIQIYDRGILTIKHEIARIR